MAAFQARKFYDPGIALAAAPQSYLPRGFCQDRPPIFVTYFEIIETQSQRLRQRSAGSVPNTGARKFP
jgi:hypothetical protein